MVKKNQLDKRVKTLQYSHMPQAVRLSDVARQAGVSRMTVSLALRHHPSLPPATRERVQRIAREMGYRPDPEIARAMKRVASHRKTHVPITLALISAQERSLLLDPDLRDLPLLRGLASHADRLGYRLEEFHVHPRQLPPGRLARALWTRRITGLLFTAMAGYPVLEDFKWENFIAVEIGTSMREPRLHRACHAHHRSTRTALTALRHKGYRRIGLVLSHPSDLHTEGQWRKSFIGELSVVGEKQIIPPLVLPSETDPAGFARWLTRHKPDVLLSAIPLTPLSPLLNENGLQVPRDIGFAHLHLATIERQTPGCSGIDQNSELIARAGMDLLLGKMETNTFGLPGLPETVTIDGTWIDGTTTRCQ